MSLLLLAALLLPTPDDDAAVARVGSRTFSRDELGDWMLERHGWVHVQEYVQEQLLLSAAERAGLLPSEDELAAAWKSRRAQLVKDSYRGEEARYLEDLRRKGVDVEAHEARQRAELRVELCLTALTRADRQPSEEALHQRFAERFGDLAERVRLEILFFSAYHGLTPEAPRPDLGELKNAAKLRAERARERLLAGAPLDDLLADSDPIRSDLVHEGRIDGYRRRMLGPELEAAVSSLDERGEVSPPVLVWDGCYVARLVERRSVSFEEERETLAREMAEQPPTTEEMATTRERVFREQEMEILLR